MAVLEANGSKKKGQCKQTTTYLSQNCFSFICVFFFLFLFVCLFVVVFLFHTRDNKCTVSDMGCKCLVGVSR